MRILHFLVLPILHFLSLHSVEIKKQAIKTHQKMFPLFSRERCLFDNVKTNVTSEDVFIRMIDKHRG